MTILILVVSFGGLAVYFLRGTSPPIPKSSKTVKISLREPYTRKLIVEKTISDQKVIQIMAGTFSSARSCQDHKCASIGTISFISEAGTRSLEVLPGHDASRYEFRVDGDIYCLLRESYINGLVAAGIARDDIRLDEHPNIEQPAPSDGEKPPE